MLDPNFLYNNLEWVAKKLIHRNFDVDIDRLRQQNDLRKILQKKIENLQSKRKSTAKIIGIAKIQGKNIESLCKKSDLLNRKLNEIKLEIKILQEKIRKYQLSFPNIPDDQVPNGSKEQDNFEIMRWGDIRRYNFIPRDHLTLGNLMGGLDLSGAVKTAGSRFIVMKGGLARLHRALSQFMMDVHTQNHGYKEYYVPYLVNIKSLYGSGQLPKFHSDLFHVQSLVSSKSKNCSYSLIPTAEVPLVNLVQDTILNEDDLPIKMVAHTPCFRSEAGTYGRRNHGLIRTHQFEKVELVQIVHPDHSNGALEEITGHAEKILQLLKLPYRKMLLSSGNMSFASCKTYDLEVWLPSHNMYCEISSCSNIKDFQSRRIKARFKSKMHKKIKLLHTLNASGLALGRALAAILENYQLDNGSVAIPTVLYPYMHGLTHIS